MLFIIALSACGQKETSGKYLIIDEGEVQKIEVTNHCSPLDSCQFLTFQLDEEMASDFIQTLKQAPALSLCKFSPKYMIDVYLKNDSVRTFRSALIAIKEDNDWCFEMKDQNYVERIWTTLYERSISQEKE